jgi:hypothetical protein
MAELVDAPDSKSGHFGGVGSIKQYGSMAELVDAPDSKSGHFGGVGFIYARFTL